MKKIEVKVKAKEYRESRIAPAKDHINPCVDIVMSHPINPQFCLFPLPKTILFLH
jgi:hypothetical protein